MRALAKRPRHLEIIDRTAERREITAAQLLATAAALSRHIQRTIPDHRVAVAELGAVIHLHRDAGQLLDHELAHQSRMPGGPAGDQDDLVDGGEMLIKLLHPLDEDRRALFGKPPADGVPDGPGLLVDLLEHEVLVAALLRQDGAPKHLLDRTLDRLAVERRDMHPFPREDHHLAVVQEEDVSCVAQNRRDVRGKKEVPLSQTDHQRALASRAHDSTRIPLPEDADGVGPGEVGEGPARGPLDVRVLLQILLDQVGDDFGVGLGAKDVPFGDKLLLEGQVVLDDPVVDDHQIAGAVRMRMGVLLGGPTVRRPAGVPQPHGPGEVRSPDGALQLFDLPDRAIDHHPALLQDGQPRGIIATVFQALQPVDQDRHDLLVPDVPHDPTHSLSLRSE